MATQSPQLFQDLYGAQMTNLSGFYGDPNIAKTKRENAYTTALQDYTNLVGGGGGGGVGGTTPSTYRSARSPLPKPILSGTTGAVRSSVAGDGTGGAAPGSVISGYDTAKVEGLAQRLAAPGVRNLRNALQTTSQGYYENPNVKAQTLRDALAGYGSGLESVEAGALGSAANIYGQEYGAKFQAGLQAQRLATEEDIVSRQIASNEMLAQYGNEFKAYLASLG